MSHEHTWSLAWTVEDLRFRVSYGLPADAHRLRILEETFEAEDPTHPLVLNRKAALALPEHFPAPDPALSPAALAFRKGEYVAAVELLFPLAGRRVPGALAALGDVLLAVGRAEEAERRYLEARAKEGPGPTVLVRLARCRLLAGDARAAAGLSAEALAQNPLYGTARAVREESAEARGRRLLALPTPDRLDPQTKALLEHLRGLGLMEAWRHAATLCPARAPAFREWRDGGGERQLLALWGEALEVAEREERMG